MTVLHGLFGEKSTTPMTATESPVASPTPRAVSMWPLHILNTDDLPSDGDSVDQIIRSIPDPGKRF